MSPSLVPEPPVSERPNPRLRLVAPPLMFRIKICGITSVDDAFLAADAGADAIGLNFYEKSPRCITAERAREIRGALACAAR